jgi:hypothetical protein
MARSSNNLKITIAATGQSDHIDLPPGEHTLFITGGGTYAGTLQIGNGTTFNDAYIGDAAADFSNTSNNSFVVNGGSYALQVDTYGSSAITCEVLSSRT